MFEEKMITVGELRDLVLRDDLEIEIDTPDGYQKIVSWWDKGVLPMVSIETDNEFSTRCATSHLLQTSSNGPWIMASELSVGDTVFTIYGKDTIIAVTDAEDEECYDFEIAHRNHRYWGDGFSSHNSGKSYIVSGNVVRNALAAGVSVILLDSEDAVKRKWATALGVDPEHPNLIRWNKNTVNLVASVIGDFMKDYAIEYKDTPREDQPPVLFVIDSLGNLNSETEIEQFSKGDLKGDKGIKAKALKMLVTNCIRLFSGFQAGLVCTNHTYKSQDMYNPDDVISGGQGQIFASDIVVSINKRKLKQDEDGNKIKEVTGIRSVIKCVKTRYAKPFEEVEVHIPYLTGMDPYSGLFELCEQRKVFVKNGNRYCYTSTIGAEYKLYRKEMTSEFYDMVMREWNDDRDIVVGTPDITVAEDAADVE
jgi:RecA/RadA recombinase